MNMQSRSVVNPITSDIRVLLNFLPLKGGKFLLFIVVTIFKLEEFPPHFTAKQTVTQPETFEGMAFWMRTLGFNEIDIPKSPAFFGMQLTEDKKWEEIPAEAVQDELPF